ncbi:hypothetical protein [Flavonifractor sp. An306]|uniref:hypothetical protein n=1 Tax=Flavonifractor sp. An306 TaxID=1965629 RepID=UPI00262299A0|nr:hypothetical protein [Flavonifractor sp. An306]
MKIFAWLNAADVGHLWNRQKTAALFKSCELDLHPGISPVLPAAVSDFDWLTLADWRSSFLNAFLGIFAYAIGGCLWLAFQYFTTQYESGRRIQHFLLEILVGVLLVADLSMLYMSVDLLALIDASLVAIASLWVSAAALFIGSVIVEIKNQPQRYTVRKRNIKYGLQSMSGGIVFLLLLGSFQPVTYSANQSLSGGLLHVFPGLLLSVLLVCSSTMLWKGVRYISWAIKNSGALKPGSKDMKNLRKSARR